MPKNIGALHFIGIGGIGMSGIAEILAGAGYQVQGSDLAESSNTRRLRDNKIRIAIGHRSENILDAAGNDPSCVIISSAVKEGNPELVAARQKLIPVLRRADMLAELMRLKWAVAISGTHGKTTTTAMIGQMLEAAALDPTIINGGIVNAYGTNMRHGEGGWMVVEADESDGTFTRLPASIAVVTNIDAEHMDHYGTFDRMKDAFAQFIHNLPFYGYAVLCLDDPEVQSLIPRVSDRRIITYGFNPQADVYASNIRTDAGGSTFDVSFSARLSGKAESAIKDMQLPMLGRHNVLNSLAALAIAKEREIPTATMRQAFAAFKGVKRRFTKTGEVRGIAIIDDYAHHPVEIETVLKTARLVQLETGGKIIAVMQPHRYSRLHDLFERFCTCFNEADTVLIADVYAAGEDPIPGASRDALVQGVRGHGHKDARALEEKAALVPQLAALSAPGDMIVFMGAGDITAWAQDCPAQLEEFLKKSEKSVA